MGERWQPIPKPVRLACAGLSAVTSLALAACGPTPAPKPSEVQQPGLSPALATKVETPPPQGACL